MNMGEKSSSISHFFSLLCANCFGFLPEPSTFTCGICMEDMPSSSKFRGKKCFHPFCSPCIARYAAVAIQENRPDVTCPSPKCAGLIDPLACRSMLPANTFVQWCDALCRLLVGDLPVSDCPFRDCGALVVSECGVRPRLVGCPSCRRSFCFRCKRLTHSSYYCDVRERDDALFEDLAKRRGWRRCPKCKRCIEHIDGCLEIWQIHIFHK